MHSYKVNQSVKKSFKIARFLSALTVILSLFSIPVFATDQLQQVPDLLSAASYKNNRALNSLQLAVGNAGKRLVSVGERGIVLLSDDNGHSWRQAEYVPVSVALTDVSFVSEKLGWASGHSGVVLHTDDGGENWGKQIDGKQVAQVIYDEAIARLNAGDESAKPEVKNAEYLLKEGADKPFLSIKFSDQNAGWVIGAYGIAITTEDGGKSWQSLAGRIPNPGGKHLYQFTQKQNLLIISGEQGALFTSRDGGQTFNKIETPYPGTFFGSIGLDDGEILAYGLRGNVWRSYDQASRWQKVELGQAVTITSGARQSDGNIVLTDESGRIFRSNAKGCKFVALDVPPVAGLTGITEAMDGSVILTSSRGSRRISKTINLEVVNNEP